jgi:hypothetical protein
MFLSDDNAKRDHEKMWRGIVVCSSQNIRTCRVGLFFTEQKNLLTSLPKGNVPGRVLLVENQKNRIHR